MCAEVTGCSGQCTCTVAAVSLGVSKHARTHTCTDTPTPTHTHTECGYCLEQLTVQITNLTELINTTLIQLPEPTLVINMTILNTLRENISRVQVSVCTSPLFLLFPPVVLSFLPLFCPLFLSSFISLVFLLSFSSPV